MAYQIFLDGKKQKQKPMQHAEQRAEHQTNRRKNQQHAEQHVEHLTSKIS